MDDRRTQCEGHLVGRHVLVALTGGIACYKVASLVSSLVQVGATVDVIMTEAASHFITPLTFESLTGRQVYDCQWKQGESCTPLHIQLAENADAVIVAPCTMNMLSKLAQGMTNDPVSLVISAVDRAATPVILAPAMNVTMYGQPATQRNLDTLQHDGFTILQPEDGWQACKSMGSGRLPEPETLFEALADCFAYRFNS
jgi:phosphopantothenoylcysteine decarboxylase/phosphopantothenate--cysteine ligase